MHFLVGAPSVSEVRVSSHSEQASNLRIFRSCPHLCRVLTAHNCEVHTTCERSIGLVGVLQKSKRSRYFFNVFHKSFLYYNSYDTPRSPISMLLVTQLRVNMNFFCISLIWIRLFTYSKKYAIKYKLYIHIGRHNYTGWFF